MSEGNQRREGGSVTKVVTIENLLGDQLTATHGESWWNRWESNHGLLNAIIPDLSRASYSWKKYPAFLTVKGQQFFWF
jgi:hypothetical protein